MLLDMEQHSSLMSLNMSPFHLSPQASPQGAGGQQQVHQQQAHPANQQYGSSPYTSCAQNSGSNMCHQQQSQHHPQAQTQNMSGFEAAFFETGSSGLEERCPMCGDKMSGYQYGLLTCESCKGFFKRNSSPCSSKKVYTCLFSPTGGGGDGGGGGGGGCGTSPSMETAGYASNGTNNNNNNNGSNGHGVTGNGGPQNGSASNGSSNNGNSMSAPGSGMCHPSLASVGVGVVTGSIPGPSEFPDTKDVIEELCPVCGDKVSGYHYGLLTCESCKGFFKRTVQNKKVYTCVAERSCHIDKTQRKRCPYCRFQKCLEVGMKLEAVRADRMRGGRNKFGPMYKRDRARKLQMMRQRQLALQTIRGSLGEPTGYSANVTPFLHIKQEIQIPQVSSLTSSPDSSPSPAGGVALGNQLQASTVQAGTGTTGNPSNNGATGPQSGLGPLGGHQQTHPMLGATQQNLNSPASGLHQTGLESKLWPANSTTPSPKGTHQFGYTNTVGETGQASHSGQNMTAVQAKTSPMIREFVQSIDDREWQSSLFGLLQNQTYNQCEVDLFELMCKVLDQNLFSQVDWARNSVFFKDLKVDDQMKLLQHSWSDMLVLDHLHQRLHNNLPDETTLHNGQKFDLLCLGLLGVPSLADLFNNLSSKLQDLKFDLSDYICMKFLMLLNHDVRGLVNKKHVQEGHEQVQQALLDYAINCYPGIPDKFNKLLAVLPEIHVVASRGEDHLYQKHCNGGAPTQTLLMEMLHAKRK